MCSGARACRRRWPYEARRGKTRKGSEAIHRREFVLRDEPINGLGTSKGGACHDSRRWNQLLLAAGTTGRRELSRRAESATDNRYARGTLKLR
jgi:hypothetical protein